MKLAVASDHAATDERLALVAHLTEAGHEVADLGNAPGEPADYPDVAAAVARQVAAGTADLGFVLCGTGIGVAMAATKVPGVRAATIYDEWSAEMARRHNDANVGCFGARKFSSSAIQRMAEAFLAASFDGGRHARRVAKIDALDSATQPS